MKHPALLTIVILLLYAASASATPVFTDTFTSGTAADAGYYRFGTTNTTLAVGGGDLDFAYASGATTRSGFIKSFTEQTLAVGDSITFSFDVTARSLASGENHAFRWAIGNLGNPTSVPGVPVTADLSSATPFSSGTRLMYQFSASTGSTAGFGQYVTGSSSPVHNSGGSATAITSFSGPANIPTTGTGSVSLTITRTGTNDYSFSQTAFGTNSSGTLTGAGTNIFNTIAFSMNNVNTYSVSVDNVSVSVIPEPTALSLIGIGLASAVMLKRRKV